MNTPATEAFVPLIAASGPGTDTAEFRVTVLRKAEAAKPLLTQIKQASATPPADSRACEPRVTLQREGQRVSGIRIECVCGAVTELECAYDLPAGK